MPKHTWILIIIKQSGLPHQNTVNKRIKLCGYTILQTKTVQLHFDQAAEFYHAFSTSAYYPFVVMEIAEKPINVLCLNYPESDVDCSSLHHADRLRHIVLLDFIDDIYVSDSPDDLKFFFDVSENYNAVTSHPTVDSLFDYLNKNIYPVVIRALKELTEEHVSPDQCIVKMARKLFSIYTTVDPCLVNSMQSFNRYEILIKEIYGMQDKLKMKRFF